MGEKGLPIRNLILDMDGVLWRGDTAVPGLVEFFSTLRALNIGFILATNNATKTVSQYVEKLARLGVNLPAKQILTSAEATATYLYRHYPPGTSVYVIGEEGLQSVLVEHGFTVRAVDDPLGNDERVEVVVVGLAREVCYRQLANAALLIRRGAKFIGTNPDPTLPTEIGAMPGAGALLAFLEASTGTKPLVIGKPNRAIFEQALKQIKAFPGETAMVGDRIGTDIAGGRAAGLWTILLLSGATGRSEAEASPISPDWIFDDIQSLAEFLRLNTPGAVS
jgi:4-nitrophenyl phosphatase